jgi:hypothetical protein
MTALARAAPKYATSNRRIAAALESKTIISNYTRHNTHHNETISIGGNHHRCPQHANAVAG